MKPLDLADKTYNRLTAIKRVENHPKTKVAQWLFKCECGNTHVACGHLVVRGNTKSCGCISKENPAHLKHGQAGTRTYNVWAMMKRRCNDPTGKFYQHYGGRGITYDPEWENFEQFFSDMGEAPEGLTLERKDTNGDYNNNNCEWASRTQQVRNRRMTLMLEHEGQVRPLAEWADLYGIKYPTLWYRYNQGMRPPSLFNTYGLTKP